jgi:SulP family sulfate permease
MDGESGAHPGATRGIVKTALAGLLPPLTWLRGYDRAALASDALAAVIVTIMLIPQSLAYALLAGLPAEMGLYASILPLAAYALFGSSRTLSVGPVAVVSLMTATAVGSIAAEGTLGYATAAIAMALLSGMMLIGMGLLRFGYLANLLSHPVVSGFITASGIIIALSQLRHILGISGHGETLPTLLASLAAHLGDSNGVTLVTGLAALAFLFWVRSGLAPLLLRAGCRHSPRACWRRRVPCWSSSRLPWPALPWASRRAAWPWSERYPADCPLSPCRRLTLACGQSWPHPRC